MLRLEVSSSYIVAATSAGTRATMESDSVHDTMTMNRTARSHSLAAK